MQSTEWVHEVLWVPKVKVIHWPWSRSLSFNIFQLLFLNNRWFEHFLSTQVGDTGPMVLWLCDLFRVKKETFEKSPWLSRIPWGVLRIFPTSKWCQIANQFILCFHLFPVLWSPFTMGEVGCGGEQILIYASAWQNQQIDLCAQGKLRSAWASAQDDQIIVVRVKKHWVLDYP